MQKKIKWVKTFLGVIIMALGILALIDIFRGIAGAGGYDEIVDGTVGRNFLIPMNITVGVLMMLDFVPERKRIFWSYFAIACPVFIVGCYMIFAPVNHSIGLMLTVISILLLVIAVMGHIINSSSKKRGEES